ncbi:MAG: hypothetical protein N2449_09900 [Bacteroidales bacterium]|nr:hypothetical protein [Bacteroidales bacterium]
MSDKYIYKAFDFIIHSDIKLDNLLNFNTERCGNLYIKKPYKPYKKDNPIYNTQRIEIFNDGFDFHPLNFSFSFNYSEHTIYTSEVEHELFSSYIVGPVLALCSCFYKNIPLHAAGLNIDNKGFLIIGNSGTGKSTLLYYLLKKFKAQYISDDIVMLKKSQNIIEAIPSFSGIKLWYDTINILEATKKQQVNKFIQKYYVVDNDFFIPQLLTPKVLIFLHTSTSKSLTIEEIKGSKKWAQLHSHIYRKPWIEQSFGSLMFDILSTLSNQCRAFNIIRPLQTNFQLWEQTIDAFIKSLL